MTLRLPCFLLLLASLASAIGGDTLQAAEEEKFNYDETKVPTFLLPDPLHFETGTKVRDANEWRTRRRPELLELFQTQVYGRRPADPQSIEFELLESNPNALAGAATRKRIQIFFFGKEFPDVRMTLTLFVPNTANKPVPAFVGMHLFDSQADHPIPGKPLQEKVEKDLPGAKTLDVILARGYAIGTLDAKDFCPDDAKRFRDGVLSHLYPGRSGAPAAEEPGAIATWAWGLSRALDYLETDKDIDAKRVAVIGHSRMGKTALWAGAQDERFAMVISNNSGCGGAALSKRRFGETVARINRAFPHWFCANFSKYDNREEELPIDQHELIALSAPRPVYVASALEDRWADPKGEFLAALGADPVFEFLGVPGLGTKEMPPTGKSIGGNLGYHLRVGPHALSDYDWMMYLDFADRHLRKEE
ncbi:MAG: acetylxylan esterase [Planctomycetota bacterium]